MEAIFEDPVTFEVMRDAVVSACGHSFSMASISQWLERHDTCPICKHVLRVEECTPNYALRNAIEQYVRATSPPMPPSLPPSPSPSSSLSTSLSTTGRSSSLNRINISSIINTNPEAYCKIREIRGEDVESGGTIMEAAFRDAAYTRYFYPDAGNFKVQAMKWFYGKMIQFALQNGRVWAAYDGDQPNKLQGVALWQPPYESGVSFWSLVKSGMASAPWNLGVKPAWRLLSVLDQAEKKHLQTITSPHWALYTVAVDPKAQNQGIGSKLLKPILAMADADGLPCYLDTPSERSLPFFRRLGFEVVLDVEHPAAGPRFWTMLRPPQPLLRH